MNSDSSKHTVAPPTHLSPQRLLSRLTLHLTGDSTYIKSHVSFIDTPPHHLRVFYAQHSLVTVLPEPIPLIVFIHGLGGQINQFEPLLKYFGQVADVLAIDLPGCGGSPMIPASWDHYTSDALTDLIKRILDERCTNRKLVLIGHSLGTILVGKLAVLYGEKCLAAVLLCPKAGISEKEPKGIQFITRLPESVFNFFRWRDRAYSSITFRGLTAIRGGIHSTSVRRMVGLNASEDVRIQQLVWNIESQTPTTLRFLRGAKTLAREEWSQIVEPILIIVGEKVTPPCTPIEPENTV
jgi:pimeloyl-ACP methyl ester carboxylesterase